MGMGNINFLDNIIKMASSSVETKAEVTMVKLLSSLNQILLFHCFVMMMFAALLRTESEAITPPKKATMTRVSSWIVRMLFQAFYPASLLLLLVLWWSAEEGELCWIFSCRKEKI